MGRASGLTKERRASSRRRKKTQIANLFSRRNVRWALLAFLGRRLEARRSLAAAARRTRSSQTSGALWYRPEFFPAMAFDTARDAPLLSPSRAETRRTPQLRF